MAIYGGRQLRGGADAGAKGLGDYLFGLGRGALLPARSGNAGGGENGGSAGGGHGGEPDGGEAGEPAGVGVEGGRPADAGKREWGRGGGGTDGVGQGIYGRRAAVE